MKLNKKQLVERLSNEMAMSKTQTEILLEEVFQCFSDILSEGNTISIPKFGKFEVTKSNARTGRNPQTGETIKIPEKNRVRFKPSQILKDNVQ